VRESNPVWAALDLHFPGLINPTPTNETRRAAQALCGHYPLKNALNDITDLARQIDTAAGLPALKAERDAALIERDTARAALAGFLMSGDPRAAAEARRLLASSERERDALAGRVAELEVVLRVCKDAIGAPIAHPAAQKAYAAIRQALAKGGKGGS
jgi:hypothetical protein